MKGKSPAYVSHVRIERKEGAERLAWLPAEKAPVIFGMHGPVAEHYGSRAEDVKNPHATTLDYVVAAAGG